jgi:hypothetical protein
MEEVNVAGGVLVPPSSMSEKHAHRVSSTDPSHAVVFESAPVSGELAEG